MKIIHVLRIRIVCYSGMSYLFELDVKNHDLFGMSYLLS